MYANASIVVRQTADGRQELDLGGEINVYCASQLHTELVRLADSGQDVDVCCDHVDAFDTAALQLLLALHECLASQGKCVRLRSLSQEQQSLLHLAGVADRLDLVATASGSEHGGGDSPCFGPD